MAVEGLGRLEANIDNIKRRLTGEVVTQALMTGGFVIERQMKINAPVDTGRLRASITTEPVDDIVVIVKPRTNYASDVEFGTMKQRPQPYMRPAFQAKSGEAIGAVASVLEGEVEKAVKR